VPSGIVKATELAKVKLSIRAVCRGIVIVSISKSERRPWLAASRRFSSCRNPRAVFDQRAGILNPKHAIKCADRNRQLSSEAQDGNRKCVLACQFVRLAAAQA
jgi:hypothetical protein